MNTRNFEHYRIIYIPHSAIRKYTIAVLIELLSITSGRETRTLQEMRDNVCVCVCVCVCDVCVKRQRVTKNISYL